MSHARVVVLDVDLRKYWYGQHGLSAALAKARRCREKHARYHAARKQQQLL